MGYITIKEDVGTFITKTINKAHLRWNNRFNAEAKLAFKLLRSYTVSTPRAGPKTPFEKGLADLKRQNEIFNKCFRLG